MNCQEFQEILQDLARYEGLDGATLKQALEHAEGCKPCDDLIEEADALSADLRALAEQDASRQAPAYIETALLAAFSEHHASVRQRSRRRWAVAAGALGIAATGLFALLLSRHAKPPASEASRLPSAAIVAANTIAANGPQATEDPSVDSQRGALSILDEDGVASSFLPLTETFDASSLDGDAVLRVALSRADLANFGLPSTALAKQSDQQVLADLIVSSDGVPQAIRLLPR